MEPGRGWRATETPIYHLEKVVQTRDEDRADFTGPLDLILALLAKNKMEIQDISIALILEQYMAWIARRRAMDLEVASEFITMAAQLMFIKSRMLLSIKDEEAISELEQLIASLEERQRHENYVRIQAVVPELSDRYSLGRDLMTKTPEHLPVNRLYRYSQKPGELLRAMLRMRERVDSQPLSPFAAFEGIVGREPYPVSEKAQEILSRLRRFGVTRFRALFRGNRSRSEIVATFLAVLELCRARRLRLAGTESDCTVTCTGGGDEAYEFSSDVYQAEEGRPSWN